MLHAFKIKIPDYFIRVENLYEDVKRLPFFDADDSVTQERIKFYFGSDYFPGGYYEEGVAGGVLKRDPNNPRLSDYKSYYSTQAELDIVYDSYKIIFEKLGYPREFI